MFFRGRQIDPLRLWADYCEIEESQGPFLPLCFCPNPNHLNSRTPAFQINIYRPTVHCFSRCGISGDYAHAVCIIEGIYNKYDISEDDLRVARERPNLQDNKGVLVARAKVRKAHREAKKIIFRKASSWEVAGSHNNNLALRSKNRRGDNELSPSNELIEATLANYSYLPKEALEYLRKRGINHSSVARWQLGYDEEARRLTIPVRDKRNRLQFIIRRGIYRYQRPPYLYPDDSSKSSLLFGGCALRSDLLSSEGLIVVEGPFDCIRLSQHGFANVVAILGNSLSEKQKHQIVRLNPKCIYLFLDHDEAGVRGIERASNMLKKKYPIKVPLYPRLKKENLDPASLTADQVKNAIRKAVPLLRVEAKLRKVRNASYV